MGKNLPLESVVGDRTYRIEEFSPEYGFDIYVYEGGKCIYDGFQETIEICKEFALEEFGVPLDSWELVDE